MGHCTSSYWEHASGGAWTWGRARLGPVLCPVIHAHRPESGQLEGCGVQTREQPGHERLGMRLGPVMIKMDPPNWFPPELIFWWIRTPWNLFYRKIWTPSEKLGLKGRNISVSACKSHALIYKSSAIHLDGSSAMEKIRASDVVMWSKYMYMTTVFFSNWLTPWVCTAHLH